MRKNLALLTSILALCLGMTACVSIGRGFNAAAVSQITLDKTTQSDIERLFGEPFRTGVDSGDTTWTYVNYRFGVFSGQQATDLLVKFNGDGTVKSYAFNTTQPEPEKK